MKVLDRHLISLGLRRWLLVLFIGTFLVMLGDFIGRLGDYLIVIASARWYLFLFTELVNLPGYLLTWLPLSTLVAAMLTAAPMIQQGTLTAACAAGIPPARVFRTFLLLAVATGLVALILGDQVVPRLATFAERLDAAMAHGTDLRSDRARAAGWRSGDTVWSAAVGRPSIGGFAGVAAFRADASRRMLMADSLNWRNGQWQLEGVLVVDGAQQREYPSARPEELGFSLTLHRDGLAQALKPDEARTSDELFRNGASRRWQILSARIAAALLPLLCLCYGLPRFVCWNDRTRLGVVGAAALCWSVIPLLAIALLGQLLVSAGAQPVMLALGTLGALIAIGVLRWRHMRL